MSRAKASGRKDATEQWLGMRLGHNAETRGRRRARGDLFL